jgi:hypothetical protein
MELLLGEREQLRCRHRLAEDRGRWRWSQVAASLVEALPGLPVTARGSLSRAGLRAVARALRREPP